MYKLYFLTLLVLSGTFSHLCAKEIKTDNDSVFDRLLTFAGYIEASIDNEDPSFFNKSFDIDAFIKIIANNNTSEASESFKKGFADELKNNLDFGAGIVEEIHKGGSYKFLNAHYEEGSGEILFRLLSSQTINYHKLNIEFINNEFRITDIYIFQSGEKLSESIGRLYNAFSLLVENQKNPNPVKWNSYFESEKINILISEGKYKKAHRKILSLPEKIRNEELFRIMDMQIASELDRETFSKVYNNYITDFPENHGKYLIPLDGLMAHKEYQSALDCIDSLDKNLNVDPLLNLLRANIYYQMNEYEQAAMKLSVLINTIPEYESGYFILLNIYIEQKEYIKATHLLDNMIGVFNYYKEDFQPLLAEYPAFINSTEYKDWVN